MEFPFGHNHHHRRDDDDDDDETRRRRDQEPHLYPPPGQRAYPPADPYQRPPPNYGRAGGVEGYYGENTYPRPPPASPPFGGPSPPPPRSDYAGGGYGYVSGTAYPPQPVVQHVAHEVGPGPYGPSPGYEESGSRHGHHGGHFPFFPHRESHQGPSNVRTVRVYTKAAEGYSLTIRNGQVVLAPSDRSDEYQHWIKDEKYSTKVKDEEGLPSFALVNKVTGQAIKHSIGATHPVRLVTYNPDYLDESVLWTESKDTGERFRCIRMVNNIRLNFDAFHGDKDHGGVRDGTTIVLWEWLKGENQRWKITPY